METSKGQAAPESRTPDTLTVEQPTDDPAIAALLDFAPVPSGTGRSDGWTPERQRGFIAALAACGSKSKAVRIVGMSLASLGNLQKREGSDGFAQAYESALGHYRARDGAFIAQGVAYAEKASHFTPQSRRGGGKDEQLRPLPGQVMNEDGEYEDEDSYAERAEEARNSICTKILRIRRLYLAEISQCEGKRAAFEILTEYPIDWDKAARGEPQDDEPYNIANQRQADMVLASESGWAWGHIGYGKDREADARAIVDRWRAERGQPAIQWESGDEPEDVEQ